MLTRQEMEISINEISHKVPDRIVQALTLDFQLCITETWPSWQMFLNEDIFL